jgi:hypothetical protein
MGGACVPVSTGSTKDLRAWSFSHILELPQHCIVVSDLRPGVKQVRNGMMVPMMP